MKSRFDVAHVDRTTPGISALTAALHSIAWTRAARARNKKEREKRKVQAKMGMSLRTDDKVFLLRVTRVFVLKNALYFGTLVREQHLETTTSRCITCRDHNSCFERRDVETFGEESGHLFCLLSGTAAR